MSDMQDISVFLISSEEAKNNEDEKYQERQHVIYIVTTRVVADHWRRYSLYISIAKELFYDQHESHYHFLKAWHDLFEVLHAMLEREEQRWIQRSLKKQC